MDAHARSLLERLNTSTSHKVSKTSTPEPKSNITPPAVESKDSEECKRASPVPYRSHQNSLSSPAIAAIPESTMSVKDLLVSARHRSRESTENDAGLAIPETTMNGASATIHSVPTDPDESISTTTGENDPKLVINTSDGDSSGVLEEMPSTPGGSNNSSLVSSGSDSRAVPDTAPLHRPQGFRVSCDGPSVVTLPTMNAQIPRLQTTTDVSGRTFSGEGIEQIANISRTFGHYDRDIIGATTKYIVYALKDGRIRIIDQNTGTRALAETPSTAPVISLSVRDGNDSDESYILVLDAAHDLTIWSIKPWKVDSANVPLDYLIRIRTAGRKADQSFPPIAKWWPRYANCLAVCTGLAVCIYVFGDTQSGQKINISGDTEHAVLIPVATGVRDFCFSADGSALAVLDFHGDVLLWPLCSDPEFSAFFNTSRLTTKLTLPTPAIKFTLPMDLNPCSIQFLDLGMENEKALSTPLLLVGSSNNRQLHLIDISGGKILQELRLPSFMNEALPTQNFSMVYTKEKRFLVIGDNLSNSIFFLHLHLPEYSEMMMSQSDFLSEIATANCTKSVISTEGLPVFNYITELPFIKNRRLQALTVTTSLDAALDVFTAHSEGFTMISPEKEEILPENYLEAKPVHAEYLQKPTLHREVFYVEHKSEERVKSPRAPSRASSTESLRSARESKRTVIKKESIEDLRENARSEDTEVVLNRSSIADIDSSENIKREVSPAAGEIQPRRSPSPVAETKISQGGDFGPSHLEIETILNQALEQQFQRLLAEQKFLTSAADDRHESILKVVSTTLTTNVGKLLEQTVRTSIEKSILPAISTIVKKSIDQHLTKALDPLQKSIPKELKSSVGDSINRALLDNDGELKFLDTLSQMVVTNLGPVVNKELSAGLGSTVEKSLGVMVGKMEERLHTSIEKSLQRVHKENRGSHQETAKKMDFLTQSVALISQQLKDYEAKSVSGGSSPNSSPTSPVSRLKQKMTDQFKAGNYSDAIETWSDSVDSEQAALFEVLLDYDPSILRGVEQLSLMSAANAVSVELKSDVEKRLQWLEKILSLAKLEGNYSEYWPRVLGLLDQRLELAFEEVSSKDRKSPLARKIAVTQYYTQGKLAEFKP